MITFNTLNIETKSLYDSYYKRFDNEVSELTFTNLFMWRKKYNFKYAVIQNFYGYSMKHLLVSGIFRRLLAITPRELKHLF